MVITGGGASKTLGGSGMLAFSTFVNAIHDDCIPARRARYARIRGEGASGSDLSFLSVFQEIPDMIVIKASQASPIRIKGSYHRDLGIRSSKMILGTSA